MGIIVIAAGPAVAGPDARLRPAKAAQEAAELGLTAAISAADDGAIVVAAQAAGLTVDKRVYSDGRFDVRIAIGKADRVVIAGDAGGLSVATAREATVRLRPAEDPDFETQARRVRGWLAGSAAIERFRQLVDALDRQDVRTAEALSLRATGAVVAELLGDPGAARRFGRSLAARAGTFRLVQQYTVSCWDVYHRLVVQAANQLESCVNSFAPYNPMRAVCAMVWTLQVESAWFQFLACSAVPLK